MDIDEGSYAAIACRMMTGGLPYRDGVENKFPAIFYLYTAVFGLFGRYDMRAVHLFAAAAALGTALVAGAIAANLARRHGADERAAHRASWLAAILYAVFSTTYEPKLLAANTELFSVLPASLAVLVYLRARGRPGAFLATGALAGGALLFKQVAGLLLVALAGDRLIRGVLRGDLRRSVTDVVLLGLGVSGSRRCRRRHILAPRHPSRRGVLVVDVHLSSLHARCLRLGRLRGAAVQVLCPLRAGHVPSSLSRPSGPVAGGRARGVALAGRHDRRRPHRRTDVRALLPAHRPSALGPGRRRRRRVADRRVDRRAAAAGRAGGHDGLRVPRRCLAVPGADRQLAGPPSRLPDGLRLRPRANAAG